MENETLNRIKRTPTHHLESWLNWQKQVLNWYDGDSKEVRDSIKQAITALEKEIMNRESSQVEKIAVIVCEKCEKVLNSGKYILTEQMMSMPEIENRLVIVKGKCHKCLDE